MITLEEIVELEGLKFRSKDLKKSFYDKFIKNTVNYEFLKQYPELILIFKNSKKIDLNKVNWNYISIYQKLSEEFIREFKDYVYWSCISQYQKLSESFIREFQDKVHWFNISKFQKLSESFIKEFNHKVYWNNISKYQKLSENFIKEFKYKVDWYSISKYQKLSESFIKEFQNYVDCVCISIYQNLSESFIKEFKYKVDWYNISQYQKLSEEFIKEFQDKVDWYNISKYQKLSDDFISEFKNRLNLGFIEDSWNYVDVEFKKNKIIECGLYDCYDEYFIAYKGIRSDRYSYYNFQYRYLKGEIYECHADHSSRENSFGLSVWTEKDAKDYCSQLVVKVKVRYEDVARLVHDSHKIRCTKIQILN